jgi:hypothetical protein
VLTLAGCGGCGAPTAVRPSSATGSTQPSSVSPPPNGVQVPSDGVTLQSLGFAHGPRSAFSVPASALVTVRVDRVDAVTLVLASPAPLAVAAYLRRALPGAGFVVTADDTDGAAMTFHGHGWSGDFTGSAQVAAVVLRR